VPYCQRCSQFNAVEKDCKTVNSVVNTMMKNEDVTRDIATHTIKMWINNNEWHHCQNDGNTAEK